jgi:Mrp family chromosome partitioning ATPase
MNLATALATEGAARVLVVEGDLHHPALAKRLGLSPGPGIAECLEGDHNPLEFVQKIKPLGWHLLRAGARGAGNPTELLQSNAAAAMFATLREHFDWVLVDTPPAVLLTDALSLSKWADASLVVVRAGRTPQDALDRTLNLLGPKSILGIVLNGSEEVSRRYSKYNYYYSE